MTFSPAINPERFGTLDEVIAKLRMYETLGVDFICCPTYGAPIEAHKRSLQLFIDEVVPAFAAVATAA